MRILLPSAVIIVLFSTACRENKQEAIEQDSSEAIVASETGKETPLPKDVLQVTKPLIGGELYLEPDFKSSSLATLDTSQTVHVLDTSHTIFIQARIRKGTALLTGYIPKTILPEKKR